MAGDQEERDRNWKRFQSLQFDKKQAMKRLRKAESASVRHAHKFILKRWRNVRDARRIIVLWAVAVGCLIAAAGLQLYWDRSSYQTSAGALGGTYAEAVLGPIDTLNPLFASSPAGDAVGQLVFSRLLNYDTTGNLNYDLAEDVEISRNQLEYTVTLRPDVQWHDGRKLTADDVVFTTELLKDTATRTQIRGWDSIDVSKIDDRTVLFKLGSAYSPFESALTFPIMPQHILGEVSHDEIREHSFSSEPIGSGPFEFRLLQDVDMTGKRIIHLAANENYYKGTPKLSRLQLLVASDEETILTALRLNEVNGASGVSSGLIDQLPSGRYEVQTQPIQAGVYALLNNDSDILSDRSVRRALQQATDTDEIRKKVDSSAPAITTPYTKLQIGEGKEVGAPKYDIQNAAKLLDSAGWKMSKDGIRKKKDRELRLSVVTTKNADYERALETLIGQWRKIGVEVDEQIIDSSDPAQSFVQSTLQPRAYDVLLYQLTMGRDPDVFAYWHSSQAVARGLNLANYSNPIADDILASARVTGDSELRHAKHLAFSKQWLADVPAIGLYQSVTHTVVGRSVGGMSEDVKLVSPLQRYNEAYRWTVGSRTVYKTP